MTNTKVHRGDMYPASWHRKLEELAKVPFGTRREVLLDYGTKESLIPVRRRFYTALKSVGAYPTSWASSVVTMVIDLECIGVTMREDIVVTETGKEELSWGLYIVKRAEGRRGLSAGVQKLITELATDAMGSNGKNP